VPWLLIDEYQQQQHVFVSQGLWDEGRNYPNILPRDTTRNETWGFFYDPETKQSPLSGKAIVDIQRKQDKSGQTLEYVGGLF
jgi:hypothetical protein